MLGLAVGLGVGAATLLGGLIQSNAASKAAKAQTAANKEATVESGRQFDAQMAAYQAEQEAALQRYYSTQSALSPYTQAGTDALLKQRALLGLDPDRQAMIDQANREYNRVVDAAYKEKREYIEPQQPESQEEGTPIEFGIKSESSGIVGKPTGIGEVDAERAKNYNAQVNSKINAGLQYDLAVAAANEKRQKAIDYANSLPSGSDAQKAAIAAIEQGSEMQTLTQQGEEAILSNASATGGLRGGNTQGALAQFRPSLLNSLINQQYERLGALTNLGQSSVVAGAGYGGSNTVGYPSGQNTIELILNQGSINAGKELAKGAASTAIPNAFLSGLGAYAGFGGFSSTQNRGTGNSRTTSGLTMPYHTAF